MPYYKLCRSQESYRTTISAVLTCCLSSSCVHQGYLMCICLCECCHNHVCLVILSDVPMPLYPTEILCIHVAKPFLWLLISYSTFYESTVNVFFLPSSCYFVFGSSCNTQSILIYIFNTCIYISNRYVHCKYLRVPIKNMHGIVISVLAK